MNALSREDLKALMGQANGHCVSLFQPTHRVAAHTEPDRVRFKNLLRQAEGRLVEEGMRSPEARELLAPGQRLLDDTHFWQHQQDGLAVFLAPGVERNYRLPMAVDELAVVGRHFHYKPLLPMLSGDGVFYVLALSQNEARLLQGTRHQVSEVDVRDMPQGLADALRFDDPEKQLQWHTRAAVRGGQRAAMFHGQGVGTDDAKDRLLRYFRAVDAALHGELRESKAPLVLAGVEYYFAIYREANTYPHLAEQGVAGSPEEQKAADLHRRAWEVVRPVFEKAQQDREGRFRQLHGTGRATADVGEAVAAAHGGRVETLFVSTRSQQWGRFDPAAGQVELYGEARPGSEDLVDVAVRHTIAHGGEVFANNGEALPGVSPLAAVLRF